MTITLCAAATLALGAARAGEGEPRGFKVERGDGFIEIPGVGRFQLPPGVRGFQPNDEQGFGFEPDAPKAAPAPKSAGAPKPPSAPKPKPPGAALDALLARLKSAADAPEAEAIAARIQQLFARNASDTVALLSSRAAAAEMVGAEAVAAALLDRVVALDPNWSEGFVRRARARAASGDSEGASADLKAALRLEPRRFDALATLGALLEAMGDKKGALDAYRRALALDPRLESLQKAAERLRLEVDGRDI